MTEKTDETFIQRLGDGLILRRATRSDSEALAVFNARVHSDNGPDQPDERLAAWTRDLMEKPHPTVDAGDFTIVEDASTGQIVSSMNLISQTWRYGCVAFGVGRPELVGTHPDYRHRGLVRAQFEVIHRWSAERGHMLQAITGIPYFYRKFGYEMAMNLGGGREGFAPDVPKLEDGEDEPYRVRMASEADISLITQLDRQASQRYLVSCIRDESLWRYELQGKCDQNINRMELRVIEAVDGERVGFLAHPPWNWGTAMAAGLYELRPGIPWNAVTPSVVRYLYRTGNAYARRDGKESGISAFRFALGEQHPVYEVMHVALPRRHKPYAWYLRVPDLADFVKHIALVLEERLANSPCSGYSGEIKLTFYDSGLKLAFDRGQLMDVQAWQPAPYGHSGDAAFPELTFLQLLFGYRSLEELDYAFADCWWENDPVYALLIALFPKHLSNVYPLA